MSERADPFTTRMIFLRVAWMTRYQGIAGDDMPVGGGAYVAQHGFGHEIFNFQPFQNAVFGYAQPPGRKDKWSDAKINLNRIDASADESVSGVLTVWVSTAPTGGAFVVGWYKNATVFREWQAMRIYGLDFTCSPKQQKALTLAVCDFDGKVLSLDDLRILDAPKKSPFAGFEKWLLEPGPWIAGLDFPFGMPSATIRNFGWLNEATSQDWASYVKAIEKQCPARKDFKTLIESWVDPQKKSNKGKPEFVRHHRSTDEKNGVDAQSPMNCVNPALGQMFFEGNLRLARADISVEPVRRLASSNRVVVEAYPKLVARRWLFSQQGYKSDKKKSPAQTEDMKHARCDVVSAIRGMAKNDCRKSMQEHFGFTVAMKNKDAQNCISDVTGDTLDSVLCAIQAAWAWVRRGENYGIPAVCDLLEGWIIDPRTLAGDGQGVNNEPC